MKQKEEWQERAARLFCLCVAAVGGYFALKYLAPIIFPFAAAFFIAACVSGAAKRLSRVTRIPTGVWAFLLVSALVVALGFAVFYLCRHMLREITGIVKAVSADGFSALSPAFEFLEGLPVFRDFSEASYGEAERQIEEWVLSVLKSLGGVVGEILKGAVRSTPSAILGSVVTVISVYYMSVDFDGICEFLGSLVPRGIREYAAKIKTGAVYVFARLAKAYALIFLITFCEIFVGLLIIYPSYACLGALAVAAVDILPVFGAGIVLIPWGIVSLICGETFRGVGLLVLYIVVTVARQIIEPHIVGESIGVHPLGAITSMFIGYRLFGFLGMLLAPVTLCVFMKARKSGGLYRKATVNTDNLSRDK